MHGPSSLTHAPEPNYFYNFLKGIKTCCPFNFYFKKNKIVVDVFFWVFFAKSKHIENTLNILINLFKTSKNPKIA